MITAKTEHYRFAIRRLAIELCVFTFPDLTHRCPVGVELDPLWPTAIGWALDHQRLRRERVKMHYVIRNIRSWLA